MTYVKIDNEAFADALRLLSLATIRIDRQMAQISALKSENSELRAKLDVQDTEFSTLKARFEIANARHESDLKTIADLNAELTELKSKNSTLRKRFAARGQ